MAYVFKMKIEILYTIIWHNLCSTRLKKKIKAKKMIVRWCQVKDQQAVNLCKIDLMSLCSANSKKDQPNCHFYEESHSASRCMYFVFEEFCDCLKAQIAAKKSD